MAQSPLNTTIHPAQRSDAEALSELVAANALALLRPHYSDAQWHAFMRYYSVPVLREKINTQRMFCARQTNTLVGTIALDDDYVVGFYTSVQHLGQGIGTYMMNHIEQVARKQGLTEIQLAASPAALAFYYKNGWQKVRDILPVYAGVEFEETLMMKQIGL
jgi:GNAT superfamily N-acetyltransferase